MSTTTESDQMAVQSEQHSTVQLGGSVLRIHGHTNKSAGEKVAGQVFVNCQIGTPDRNSVHDIAIHEIPLARALQRLRGGEVIIIPTWADPLSLPQVKMLTRAEVIDKLVRLRGNEDPAQGPVSRGYYTHTWDDGREENMFFKVYGGKDGTRHRLFEAMRDVLTKWQEITARAIEEMRRLTIADIEECVKVCLPPDEADGLDALDVDLAGLNPGPSASAAGNAELVEFLVEVEGVNEAGANAFAAAIAASAGKEPSEKLWATVPGCGEGKNAAKNRERLMSALASFNAT